MCVAAVLTNIPIAIKRLTFDAIFHTAEKEREIPQQQSSRETLIQGGNYSKNRDSCSGVGGGGTFESYLLFLERRARLLGLLREQIDSWF
jgi:hypothetical protein